MVKFASKQTVKFFQYSLSVYTQSLSAFYHPWTVTHQALLFMGFPGQEYWNGLPLPPSWDPPYPGIEPMFPAAPAWQVDSLPLSHLGNSSITCDLLNKLSVQSVSL